MRHREPVQVVEGQDLVTYVDHWGYEDGEKEDLSGFPKEVQRVRRHNQKQTIGYYCYIYPENYEKLKEWLETNCPESDYDYKFNSGNPAFITRFTVKEAMIFKLKFLK